MDLDYEEGEMGPMYFFQIYHFNGDYGRVHDAIDTGLDQMREVIHLLRTDRFSRRILMTTYNPLQAKKGVLYPCHGIVIQFGVEGDNRLCCHMYQRSADCFLGLPYNIASYALLTILLCNHLNNCNNANNIPFVPGRLTISLGDCHIYESHLEAVQQQITREPFDFPFVSIIESITNLRNIETNWIQLENYLCHPVIRAKMVA
jgi:thymidylate synthase